MDFENSNGLILVDKSAGLTSFGTDGAIKRLLHTKKVGHIGTLDPFATGLLPVCVGKGLRFVRFADGFDKAYRCVCVIGQKTDTMDTEGEVIGGRKPTDEELEAMKANDFAVIREALDKISKITSQVPPKYSAKKIDGKKAYELAREGKEVELKPVPVKIYKIDVLSIEVNEFIEVTFEVYCSKGTYIRTICDDLGDMTGFGAHARELRRIRNGSFDIKDSYTIEQIESMLAEGDMSFISDASKIASYMPALNVNDTQVSMLKCGKKLKVAPFDKIVSEYPAGTFFRAMHGDELIAVVYADGESLKIERMLAC